MKKRNIIIIILVMLVIIILAIFAFMKKNENNSLELNKNPSQPVSIPDSTQKNCIGFDIGMPEEIELVSQIGGGWIRPNL